MDYLLVVTGSHLKQKTGKSPIIRTNIDLNSKNTAQLKPLTNCFRGYKSK